MEQRGYHQQQHPNIRNLNFGKSNENLTKLSEELLLYLLYSFASIRILLDLEMFKNNLFAFNNLLTDLISSLTFNFK